MLPPKLVTTACKFVLDEVEIGDFVDAAHDALDRGIYAHGLGEIATSRGASLSELRAMFTSAFVELGYPLPTPIESLRQLQLGYLRSIHEGTLTPTVGLERFYRECHQPFVGRRRAILEPWEDECSRELTSHWYALNEISWQFDRPERANDYAAAVELWNLETLHLVCKWSAEYSRSIIIPEWRSTDVMNLATGIDVDKAFDRLSILADALEEAGCDNYEVLFHCRENIQHTRACWVNDMLMGR